MKKVIFVLVLCLALTAPVSSLAGGNSVCDKIETFAHVVMENRQYGVSMKKQINVVETNIDLDKLERVTKSLVIDAYEEPLWPTEEHKERVIQEFANKAYRECLKGQMSD